MTKQIPLTQGKVALVDDEDYERLNSFKWCAQKSRNTYYAIRSVKNNGKNHTIRMHLMLIDVPKDMNTDHINNNGLDNRKENLRVVTIRENQQNRIASINKTSKYVGVSWNTRDKRWRAQIYHNGVHRDLGNYKDEEDAHEAYLKACEEIKD
jgi:hypothetical protein